MCYNCGCGIKDDNMGHEDNITNVTFSNLALKWKKPIEGVKKIVYEKISENMPDKDLDEAFNKASKAWGQSVENAKKETLKLLKKEIKIP